MKAVAKPIRVAIVKFVIQVFAFIAINCCFQKYYFYLKWQGLAVTFEDLAALGF